jgi:hypothetical protein
MASPAFDPNAAVRFDLKTGAASDAGGDRLLLVSASAIEAVERAHPEAAVLLGREAGHACGARVAARLGGAAGVRAAELESVVTHLAGELAVSGLGAMHLERWGRAMVLVLAHAPASSERFSGAVLAGALSAATGREVATASLGRDGAAMRFFVGSRATAARIGSLVAEGAEGAEGAGLAHVLTALQAGQAGQGGAS